MSHWPERTHKLSKPEGIWPSSHSSLAGIPMMSWRAAHGGSYPHCHLQCTVGFGDSIARCDLDNPQGLWNMNHSLLSQYLREIKQRREPSREPLVTSNVGLNTEALSQGV